MSTPNPTPIDPQAQPELARWQREAVCLEAYFHARLVRAAQSANPQLFADTAQELADGAWVLLEDHAPPDGQERLTPRPQPPAIHPRVQHRIQHRIQDLIVPLVAGALILVVLLVEAVMLLARYWAGPG